jgi:dethiobiotin synthetase
MDVGVMKPVATSGVRMGTNGRAGWVSDDARQLVRAAGVDDPWPLVNPVCFREPLAPWTAARRARTTIRLAPILAAFRALRARHEFLIVEGIGGLLVPLTQRLTVADLAKRMGLPLLIVARPGLGTLNHTLLTLQSARQHRLKVLGVLFNEAEPPSRDPMSRLAARTNPDILSRFARVPILGLVPFIKPSSVSMAGKKCPVSDPYLIRKPQRWGGGPRPYSERLADSARRHGDLARSGI